MPINEQHIGSSLDDFLEEEGILADVEAAAIKRVVTFQIEQLMKENNISKTAMAKRMKTSRAAIDRLLDPTNPSITLQTLERAAAAVGKSLQVELV
ncbi:MAG: XRE family transcriptional regulator [Anaerolineales bacterium]|nr:XRE family transcriptional regulator [Anaerolineales bacterium]